MYNKPALRLIQTSIHFDFPARPFPANVRYAGAVLDDPDWVKDWLNPWPQNDPRPLAVVTLLIFNVVSISNGSSPSTLSFNFQPKP